VTPYAPDRRLVGHDVGQVALIAALVTTVLPDGRSEAAGFLSKALAPLRVRQVGELAEAELREALYCSPAVVMP
jgi:hypothetical protein